jgi:hypothetical protein
MRMPATPAKSRNIFKFIVRDLHLLKTGERMVFRSCNGGASLVGRECRQVKLDWHSLSLLLSPEPCRVKADAVANTIESGEWVSIHLLNGAVSVGAAASSHSSGRQEQVTL